MATIIVEDGTGLSNANSYVSVADADTYLGDRGYTVWTDSTEEDLQISLIRATDYVDQNVFKSVALTEGQARQFPRYDLVDRTGEQVGSTVPVEIVNATCEYALAVIGDGDGLVELNPTPTQSTSRSLTYTREKAGEVEREYHYDAGEGVRTKVLYPRADGILSTSGFLLSGGVGGINGRSTR